MNLTAIDPYLNAMDGNRIDPRPAPFSFTNLSLAHLPGKPSNANHQSDLALSTEAFRGKDAFGTVHLLPNMLKQDNPTRQRIPPIPSALVKKTPHSDTVTTKMAKTTNSAGTNPASVPRQGNLSPQRHHSAPTAPVKNAPPPKTRTDTDPESLQQN